MRVIPVEHHRTGIGKAIRTGIGTDECDQARAPFSIRFSHTYRHHSETVVRIRRRCHLRLISLDHATTSFPGDTERKIENLKACSIPS